MSNRDDFGPATKNELAHRVAHTCSAPSCGAATIGPSDVRKGRVTNVGVGAHITAAAEGGPRYDGSLSRGERAGYGNGIWLCAIHAKLIDDNEDRYPVSLLRTWKENAERNARVRVGRPADSRVPSLLLDHAVVIPKGDESRALAHFLDDVGALEAWGPVVFEATKFLAYETALNAFDHGGAESLGVRTEKGCLFLSYEAPEFGPLDLEKAEGDGGAAALRSFKDQCDGIMELTYRHRDGVNEWSVVDLSRGLNNHPCALRLTRNIGQGADFTRVEGCAEVHVHVPDTDRIFSFSDAGKLARQLVDRLPERSYVFHGVSDDPHLRAFIVERLPRVRFAASRRRAARTDE
ncbi:hypothetical protein [Streptomyces abyssomicinicus]|uniref:hypothetical protein n=1 Tax=Streptomyces abyssomicinicus TaxID=574929 RepID=UPI00125091C5|nr:hypothetical protein [Streptomyces abyssomicinicus]